MTTTDSSSVNLDGADKSLEELALELLKGNRRTGYDPYYKFNYEYSVPSPGRYNWQWFWDSCFHVIALSRLDTGMARRPHCVYLVTRRRRGMG